MSRFLTEVPASTEAALSDIGDERERQFTKWGPQHHADGSGPDNYLPSWGVASPQVRFSVWRDYLRRMCDEGAAAGQTRWSDILLEEVFEALAEDDTTALRKELVQVAAVCAAWIEDIDSRASAEDHHELGGEG